MCVAIVRGATLTLDGIATRVTITLDARAQQRLQLPQPVLTWRQDDIGYAGDFCGVVVVGDQPSVAVGLVPHAARPSP